METSYPLCNLGAYGSTVVAAKKFGDMEAYLNNIANTNYISGYKTGSTKMGLILGIIGGVVVIGSIITTAVIVKRKCEKKAKLKVVN